MKKILVILALIPLLFGCIKQDDVRILGVEDVDITHIFKPRLVLEIENQSRKNIKLREGRLELRRNGQKVIDVMLSEEVTIERRSSGAVEIPLRVKFNDPLLLLVISTGGRPSLKDFTVQGEISGSVGAVRKTFYYEEAPIDEFLDKLGIDSRELKKFKI